MKPFLKLLNDANFCVVAKFHFNYLLFLPIFLARQVVRAFNIPLNSENEVKTRFLTACSESYSEWTSQRPHIFILRSEYRSWR